MNKNILITGGAGFIGSHLALQLLAKGYCVTVLDSLSTQVHGTGAPLPQSIKDKVLFIKGDVRDQKAWDQALKGQDAVIHLAAETGTGQSMYRVQNYVDVNIGGTAVLLDYLVNGPHHIQKVIIASSRAIYGEGKYYCSIHGDVYPEERRESDLAQGLFEPKCPFCCSLVQIKPTDENSKIHPVSVYGITKQNQEQMVMNVCKAMKIPALAFRYQNVYGPGQSLSNPYTGILSIFSTQIRNGSNINIFEDGKESRDFVYIDDVVAATILGLEKKEADYESFNVGSGVQTSVLEVAQKLRDYFNAKVAIQISGNFRVGDIRHNYADISKINELLGFRPQYNFHQGLAHFLHWVESQDMATDNYPKSIEELRTKGLFK